MPRFHGDSANRRRLRRQGIEFAFLRGRRTLEPWIDGKVINWADDYVTVKTVFPLTPLNVAEMVVVPIPTALARPCEPEVLEMVATVVLDEVQVTWVVMFFVEPPS